MVRFEPAGSRGYFCLRFWPLLLLKKQREKVRGERRRDGNRKTEIIRERRETDSEITRERGRKEELVGFLR